MSRVEPPKENRARTLTRNYLEYLANCTVFASALVPLYKVSHPSEISQLVENWREDVSEAINDHETKLQQLQEMLHPKLNISETAISIAMWIAGISEDGLTYHIYDIDDIISEFAELDDYVVKEGIAELDDIGLVDCISPLSGNGAIRPQYPLFWAFDEPALGYRTIADATALGNAVLNQTNNSTSSEKLFLSTNWELRRFNPALAYLLTCVDERRRSQENQAKYPVRSFIVLDSDRGRIRRFVHHNEL